jgi:hypothetical protein
MTDNVHALRAKRKPGPRRVRPSSDRPLANVLTLETHSVPMSLEEQLAEHEATVQEVVHALLLAVRAIKDLNQKPGGALSRD